MAVARKKPSSKAKTKTNAGNKKPAASKKVAAKAKKGKVAPAPKAKKGKAAPAPKAKKGKVAPAPKAKKGKAAPAPKKVATKPERRTATKTSAKAAKKVSTKTAEAARTATKTSAKTAKTATKTSAKTATKKVSSKNTRKEPATAPERVPPPLPSERAIAVAAQLPKERSLTDVERDAMNKVAQTALALLEQNEPSAAADAQTIVKRIGAFVDAVREGTRPEPKTQDERLGIGVLWGEQVRAQVGWRWVHLTYPDGFASYALVPDDRAFACFPLNRLAELVRGSSNGTNTSVPLFDSIRVGALPQRRENAYLVIG